MGQSAKGLRYTAAKRMRRVEELYMLGNPPIVIHRELTAEGFKVGHEVIKHDVVEVRKKWKEAIAEFMGSESGAAEWYWQNALADRLRAIANKDIRTAYLILKDLGQLTGGCKPDVQRIQVTTEDAKRLIDHVGAVLAEELADQPEVLERVLARIEKREEP